MSKAKKIGIAAIIVCCVVGIGFAVWFFVLRTPASVPQQPEAGNSGNTTQPTTINASRNNNNVSDNTATSAPVTTNTVTELGNDTPITSSLSADQERVLAEQICKDMLTRSPELNAEDYFSENVPSKFSTPVNSILMYNSGAPVNSQSYHYNNCNIMMHSVAKISGVYTRHIMNVAAIDKSTSSECALRVNIVLNANTGKMVYYDQGVVVFRQVPMVESEYADVLAAYDANRFEGVQKIQAQLLLIYSYSPFIDASYWNAIPRVIEFGNSEELSGITGYSDPNNSMTDRDIVTELERGWLPSVDGSGSRVTSIGVPEPLSQGNGYTYYKLTVMYRTDHNDEGIDDKLRGVVVKVCVNDSTGKIESLVESDPTVSKLPAGAGDIGGARTMKEFLGI